MGMIAMGYGFAMKLVLDAKFDPPDTGVTERG
jgi:hypothetical protein